MNNNLEAMELLLENPDSTSIALILASIGIGLLLVLIIMIPMIILTVVANWKIFTKAGKPGWASIIPVYNTWTLLEIVGLPGWISLFTLIGFVISGKGLINNEILTTILTLAQFVLNIVIGVKLAPLFKKEPAFAIGLILLPFIFYPIIAFGKAEYIGLSTVKEEHVIEAEPIAETKSDTKK